MEGFKIGGLEEARRRMVLDIRKLRPDVIITKLSVANNVLGHHQASARRTLEAFDAAADPKRFPEQLKEGVTVWQVQRLFVRARGNAQAQAATAPAVTIDPTNAIQFAKRFTQKKPCAVCRNTRPRAPGRRHSQNSLRAFVLSPDKAQRRASFRRFVMCSCAKRKELMR